MSLPLVGVFLPLFVVTSDTFYSAQDAMRGHNTIGKRLGWDQCLTCAHEDFGGNVELVPVDRLLGLRCQQLNVRPKSVGAYDCMFRTGGRFLVRQTKCIFQISSVEESRHDIGTFERCPQLGG